jgi:DNA-directed RNA polymerase subunit E'/Rpb7
MFMPIKFNTTVILTPKEFNKNFDNTILLKIKSTLENNCSKHGFIKKDSIKIIKRTAGYFKESHLNGNIAYDLSCIAEICNPTQDSIIKCVIKAKNNLGLRAIGTFEDMSILEVIIPRITSGIQSEINIDDVNIGDNVNVRVCGKKFTLYDKMISIVGKIIKDKQEIIEIAEDIDEDNQSDFEEQDDEDDFIELLNKDDEEEENENENENENEDEEDEDIKRIKIDAISLKEQEETDEDDGEDDEDDEDDDDEELDDLDEDLEEDFEEDFEDI